MDFPWVQVRHLASHILGRMAIRISQDWENFYGHPLYFLETFVDPERFRGTCYYAANWVRLGESVAGGRRLPQGKRQGGGFVLPDGFSRRSGDDDWRLT